MQHGDRRGSNCLVLVQQFVQQRLHVFSVLGGNGGRLSLHNLEHESEQVVGIERVLKGAEFVQDATDGPLLFFGRRGRATSKREKERICVCEH